MHGTLLSKIVSPWLHTQGKGQALVDSVSPHVYADISEGSFNSSGQ